MNRRTSFGVALALVSALFGLFIFRILAAFGPGLSVDSASTIGAARSFARSGELLVPYADWTSPVPTQRLTAFPPLLSIILGFFERAGVDALFAIRLQNAGLGAITLWLALCFVARASRFIPARGSIIGCGLVLLAMIGRSPGLLYLWGWTEPLFLLFFVLFLYGVASCRDRPERLSRWALLGILVGLASLTRYTGLSLLAAGLLAPFGQPRRRASGPQLLEPIGAFLAGFAVLYAPWFLTLRGVARASWGLAIPQLSSFVDQQLGFLGSCVLPGDARPGSLRLLGLMIFIAIVGWLLYAILRSPGADSRWAAITALAYIVFLIGAATFDRMGLSDVDGRYLAPFLLAAVLSLGSTLASPAARVPTRNNRWIAAAAAGVILTSSTYRALPRLRQSWTWGVGFERLPWRDSLLLAWLRRNASDDASLYSNQPAGIYFGTRRAAFLALAQSQAAESAAFRKKFESAPSLYVAFDDEIWEGQMNAATLAERTGLVRLKTFPDGVVYGILPPSTVPTR